MPFNVKDIQTKEFNVSVRGYNMDQVDDFLEEIAREHFEFLKNEEKLYEQVKELKNKVNKLQNENNTVDVSAGDDKNKVNKLQNDNNAVDVSAGDDKNINRAREQIEGDNSNDEDIELIWDEAQQEIDKVMQEKQKLKEKVQYLHKQLEHSRNGHSQASKSETDIDAVYSAAREKAMADVRQEHEIVQEESKKEIEALTQKSLKLQEDVQYLQSKLKEAVKESPDIGAITRETREKAAEEVKMMVEQNMGAVRKDIDEVYREYLKFKEEIINTRMDMYQTGKVQPNIGFNITIDFKNPVNILVVLVTAMSIKSIFSKKQ